MSGPRDAGFTLVETLMAIVVVATASLGLFSALAIARSMADEAHVREQAIRLSNALIIEAEHNDPATLPSDGERPGDGLQWQRQISQSTGQIPLYRIEVSVTWRSGRNAGHVNLVGHRWRGAPDAE